MKYTSVIESNYHNISLHTFNNTSLKKLLKNICKFKGRIFLRFVFYKSTNNFQCIRSSLALYKLYKILYLYKIKAIVETTPTKPLMECASDPDCKSEKKMSLKY